LAAFGRLGPGFELDVVTSRPVGQVPTDVRVHTGLTHASPELFELYRRADVFVLPTRADTLGLVFAEALAAGLPVIGCDVGAARELVIPGKTGLLVAPGSPDELAAAIRTLADSPELRARMGAHGRTLARTQHCADRNCAAVIDLLRDVSKPIPEGVTRNSRMRRWHAGEISPEAAAFDAQ
jgi:glycosyltransferase involved in cell wall biosynthesis